MKVITIGQQSVKSEWEIEVQLYSMRKQGLDTKDYIFLAYTTEKYDHKVMQGILDLQEKYGFEMHTYVDDRPYHQYPTSIRPWLWTKFLTEFPQMQKERFFYIDTDVIFTGDFNWDSLETNPNHWLASSIHSYFNPSTIDESSTYYVDYLNKIGGTDFRQMYSEDTPGVQIIVDSTTVEFWYYFYQACELLYHKYKSYQDERQVKHSKFNIWMVDMVVLWLTCHKFNIYLEVSEALEFGHNSLELDKCLKLNLYHNSLHDYYQIDNLLYFYKQDFIDKKPFGRILGYYLGNSDLFYIELLKEIDFTTMIDIRKQKPKDSFEDYYEKRNL